MFPILDENQTDMKNSTIIFIILSFFVVNMEAQELTEKENSMLDDFLKSTVTSEKEKIVTDTLNRVIPCPVFKLKGGFAEETGTSYCTESYFIIKDGKLIGFQKDNLMSVIRSTFTIKSAGDAKVFETFLDKIFPVSWTSVDKKEHFKKDNKWYFIRSDFFEFKSGFIVAIDQTGKILSIGEEMRAIAK
jgi:hypothetical protein